MGSVSAARRAGASAAPTTRSATMPQAAATDSGSVGGTS